MPPALLTTATTGVGNDDLLLAVTVIKDPGTAEQKQDTLVLNVAEDMRVKSEEYHGISATRMLATAVPDDEARAYLSSLFSNYAVYTYNPTFQRTYLEKLDRDISMLPVYNVPLVLRGAISHYILTDKNVVNMETLEHTLDKCIQGRVPGFKKMCAMRGYAASFGVMLPHERSAQDLLQMWQDLDNQQIDIQETTF